jgi:hypothetical protein
MSQSIMTVPMKVPLSTGPAPHKMSAGSFLAIHQHRPNGAASSSIGGGGGGSMKSARATPAVLKDKTAMAQSAITLFTLHLFVFMPYCRPWRRLSALRIVRKAGQFLMLRISRITACPR